MNEQARIERGHRHDWWVPGTDRKGHFDVEDGAGAEWGALTDNLGDRFSFANAGLPALIAALTSYAARLGEDTNEQGQSRSTGEAHARDSVSTIPPSGSASLIGRDE